MPPRRCATSQAGCLCFDVLLDRSDENLVWLYEVYVDEAALDAHMQTAHFLASRPQVEPLIVGQEVIEADVALLGMEVLHRANEDLVYLTCGNDNLSLGRAQVPARGEQAVDHYGFIVDSVEELDAWYAYFKALGITLLDRPFDYGDGARSFHLLDPAGNKIQPLFHPAVSGQRFSRATLRPE